MDETVREKIVQRSERLLGRVALPRRPDLPFRSWSEDVGFVVDGRVVALRPLEVYSEDYVLQEYGVTDMQAERVYKAVKADVREALASGQTKAFTGKL